MPKKNILSNLNKGVKALLYETGKIIQQTDYDDEIEVEIALEKIQELIHILTSLGLSESKNLWLLMEKYESEKILKIRKDHTSITESLQTLEKVLSEGKKLNGFDLLEDIDKMFSAIMIEGITYIHRKEEIYSTVINTPEGELTAVYLWHSILADMIIEDAAILLKWIVIGLNINELIYTLRITGENPSKSYCNIILQAAEKTQPHHRWKKVQNVVSEGTFLI
jgi:hypothetical protein